MFQEIFLLCLVVMNIFTMAHLGLFVIGGNIYDIKRFRNERLKSKDINQRKHYYKKPLVSVVVPAHNEELVIKRTLDSILASTYKNIEIIVVDDGSTDNTVKAFKAYSKKLNAKKITSYMARNSNTSMLSRHYTRTAKDHVNLVLVTQTNSGKASAMNNAIRNYVKGRYTMCLDADSQLDPEAIEKVVAYFRNRSIIGVAANVRVLDGNNFLSTLQRFEHMIGYRSKKFYTLTNSEFIVGGVASTYRTSVLKSVGLYDTDTQTEDIGLSMKIISQKGNKKHHIVYAPDVVAYTEGVQTLKALFQQRFRWKMGSLQNLIKYKNLIRNEDTDKYSRALTAYRLPVAIFGELLLFVEPIILGYVVYLCLHYHTIAILIGAYFTITIYVLSVLWPDEHLSTSQKFKLSYQACQLYLLLYIMDVVQVAAIFRCLAQYRKVIKRNNSQTWISPKRSGAGVKI